MYFSAFRGWWMYAQAALIQPDVSMGYFLFTGPANVARGECQRVGLELDLVVLELDFHLYRGDVRRSDRFRLRAGIRARGGDRHRQKAEVRELIHSCERSERLMELLESKDPEVRAAAIRGMARDDGVDPWPWPEPRPFP